MIAADDSRASDATPAFALERFAWGGPDRFELSGTFTGLGFVTGSPVLVLGAPGGEHRLPASPDDGAPADGAPWHATFVWQDAPVAFETAALELGDDVVELPEPGTGKGAKAPVVLPVRRPPHPGGERLRIEEEVVALTEELRRARADLEAERDGRAADTIAFREGLARLRGVADEALAEERSAREAELAELRERVAELDGVGAEADRLRAEAEGLRAEAEATRADAEETRRRIRAAREQLDGAAQLAGRLTDDLDGASQLAGRQTARNGEQREEG